MAELTKAEARSLVQQLIDDPGAKQWTAANLDRLLSEAYDELWGELLETSAWLRSTEATPAVTSPGYVDLAATLPRFHRVQWLMRDGQVYTEANGKDVALSGTSVVSAPDLTYVILGDLLYLFPLSTSAVTLRHSDLPEALDTLADIDTVTWPKFPMAYVYETAARAMEKGDRESSEQFQKRAEQTLQRCRAYVRKRSIGPIVPWASDEPLDWGSA